ncbi:MAG: hypothetical protein ACR2PO_19585 [Methyloligellaceae bacterium]
MKKALFSSICVLTLAALVAGAGAGPTAAQGAQKKKQPSDRAVRVIVSFAWTLVPEEYETAEGKKVKVDKSDPAKFMIPMEDARRVIRVAHVSANAQICDLAEHQAANYVKLMKREKVSKKWSEKQLLFINRLHLFTVQWLTGNVEFADAKEKKDQKRDPAEIKERLKKAAKEKSKRTCTDEQRKKIKQQIEDYVKASEKS